MDSGYTSGNEDDEPAPTPTSIRADPYEKSFVDRWLTGFLSRAEALDVFETEEGMQRALD